MHSVRPRERQHDTREGEPALERESSGFKFVSCTILVKVTFLNLSFLIYKMGIIIVQALLHRVVRIKWNNVRA